jgi:Helix-turn-helix domain
MAGVRIDAYVLDSLMRDLVGHDHRPSAFLVYLRLWRQSHGEGVSSVQVSLMDLAAGTGLSKRAVQSGLTLLVRRKLIAVKRAGITAIPVYTVLRPWERG